MKNAFSECLHIFFDTKIEKDESFDDEKSEKLNKFANCDMMINDLKVDCFERFVNKCYC